MRVVVDWNRCESNALCMAAAPDVFELQDDDSLEVLEERPAEDRRGAVTDAVRACPKAAITLED